MKAQEMWMQYSTKENLSADYEAWAFGEDADGLAQLVLDGIKTATASAYPLYELEGEALPEEGEYNVILDSRDEAVCVVKTTKVFVVAFDEVDARQAWKEGEGDRSLAYWRQVHERFFSACLEEVGMAFAPEMKVVCEEFELVYPSL